MVSFPSLSLSLSPNNPGWRQRRGQDLPSGSERPGQVPPGVLHYHCRHWFHSKCPPPPLPCSATDMARALSLWWPVCTDMTAEPILPPSLLSLRCILNPCVRACVSWLMLIMMMKAMSVIRMETGGLMNACRTKLILNNGDFTRGDVWGGSFILHGKQR